MNSAQLKKVSVISLFAALFILHSPAINAQDSLEQKTNNLLEEEEEGPLIYKFEPDFLSAEEQKKAEIMHTRAILDTLDISERKRKRLLKDLYKNGVSERLSKALFAETKFEDPDANEN
jgi:hypothetical protein